MNATDNSDQGRLDYPATHRNRDAILEVLSDVLPDEGSVLEVASGSGQHVTHFAGALKNLSWHPTDISVEARTSIDAWRDHMGLAGTVHPAIELDASKDIWSVAHIEDLRAILSINMIHISPWAACLGLLRNAGRILPQDGILYFYGPFKVGGVHTAGSNAEFDLKLQSDNPEWGVRNLDDVAEEALRQNFQLAKTVRMPANNLSVIFQRKG